MNDRSSTEWHRRVRGIIERDSEYPITVMTGNFNSVVYTQRRLPRQETIVMAKKKAASKKKTKKKAKKKR
jgi:hypothetical protein